MHLAIHSNTLPISLISFPVEKITYVFFFLKVNYSNYLNWSSYRIPGAKFQPAMQSHQGHENLMLWVHKVTESPHPHPSTQWLWRALSKSKNPDQGHELQCPQRPGKEFRRAKLAGTKAMPRSVWEVGTADSWDGGGAGGPLFHSSSPAASCRHRPQVARA